MDKNKLFELSNLIVNGNYQKQVIGYFVDKDFNFYSTRISKTPKLISVNSKTFDNGQRQKSVFINMCKNSRIFDNWLEVQKTIGGAVKLKRPSTNGTEVPRVYADSAESGVAGKGVIIATLKDGAISFGNKPKIHMSEASYTDEMARLAKLFPGTKFVAFKAIGAVIAQDLQWS